jgi:hypothetical protein
MIDFTKEELNAIAVMVSNAPIAGKDAKFVSGILDKIEASINQPKENQDEKAH